MITLRTTIFLSIIICLAFACSKKEADTAIPTAKKCANSTILDALLSGKQMYILASVYRGQVFLSIKDKKGKARAIGEGNVNQVVYEWDIEVKSVSETQVNLIAGNIIAVRGSFVAGTYSADSFFFKDNNCKITTESNDGQQLGSDRLSTYEDLTSSKDLPTILEKYLW